MLSAFFSRPNRNATSVEQTAPVAADLALPLHLLADDATLSIANGLVRIHADGALRSLRLDEISFVALHGGASVTAPALRALASALVPVVLHSRSGHYVAQLVDMSGSHSKTRRAHYTAAADGARALTLARLLVEAKIRAAARLMRRRLGAQDAVTQQLDREAISAARARNLDALRGFEGAAAAAWFAAWPRLINRDEAIFGLGGRSRRPAQTAVNALLNYLYAVLVGQSAAAAMAAGLDPNVGFLHAERPGRPALALDLVEPFRTAIVDAAVIAALNNHEFGEAHFEAQPDGGVRLTDSGRRAALALLERRLSTVLTYAGSEMSWRTALSHHAQLLARCLRDGTDSWPIPSPK